tara:strand:- start:3046 stop:6201 length:3156 start_codon:yes stop_codon:yes gene_type:complete
MIEFLVDRKRTALAILVVLIFAGFFGRSNIPIEAEPEIVVPVIYIGVSLRGISPQDAERLLLKPLEDEIRSIEGVDEMQGFAFENYAGIVVKFDAADSMKLSMDKVRDAANDAKINFPEDANDPVISELSVSDEPNIIIVINSETASERYVLNLAQQIKKDIELIPSIFEVEIAGSRDEQLEAIINRSQLENYEITFAEILRAVSNNNQVVTTGEIETAQGQFSVSVSGLFETAKDVYDLPIRSTNNSTIFLSDIAEIKRNFKDRKNYTKVNGKQSISLFVTKGRGTNLIATINQVEEIVESYISKIPDEVKISYMLDSRDLIGKQVNSLQGNILLATLFVLIITMLALGIRSSFIVGSGIPISILVSLFILYIAGYDYNFMVIFGILVALGMLIDGSLVVVEFADRKMVEGLDKTDAYIHAAKRMFWPIVASTATTLAVFIPLFFWPGIAGQFMRVLPLTIFIVLFVALFYSLLFVPVIGSVFGKPSNSSISNFKNLGSETNFDLSSLTGALGKYVNILNSIIKRPILTLIIIVSILYMIISSYLSYGPGMVFFSTSDPFFGQAKISARGNLSINEIDRLSTDVEKIITESKGIKSVFLQTGQFGGLGSSSGGNSEDTIANIFFEFTDRSDRENGHIIIRQIRHKVNEISGIKVEVSELQNGPPVGKDLEIRIMGPTTDSIIPIAEMMRAHIDKNIEGLISVEDTLPVPLVEWELIIDKPKASQFGADVFTIGSAINLVTNGVMLGKYRPSDVDDELEIFVRYPKNQRSIDQLDNIMIETNFGSIPISNFIKKKAKKNVSFIRRYDARNVVYIKANVDETTTVGAKSSELNEWVEEQNFPNYIDVVFGGENEEQNNSMKFVIQAFTISILIMAALLVTQFNSFYQSFIILSAVVMSTAGVFFGLLVFDQQFSAIMHGIGIISLAGIVVNNNIILIDAYNYIRKRSDDDIATSILKASAQRLRPIFLTTITTMLGLIPLALNYSIDPLYRNIAYDSNVTSFWAPLAQCIVYGLSFSAILTLIVTPCLIVLPSRLNEIIESIKKRTFKTLDA